MGESHDPSSFEHFKEGDLIKKDVDRTKEAENAEKDANRLRGLHVKRVEEDQRRLRCFYRTSLSILIVTVALSCTVIIYLMWRDDLEGNILIAFFISITAQIIGLAHIISKYFFPEGGGLTEMPKEG